MWLEKQAIDRIVKEYRKGNLSHEALKKLQQSGAIRPIERYIDGINKGSNAILDKNVGIDIVKPGPLFPIVSKTPRVPIETPKNYKDLFKAITGGGYINELHDRILKVNPDKFSHRLASPMLPMFNKKKAKLMDAIMTRHEAYEEKYGTKNTNRLFKVNEKIKQIEASNLPLEEKRRLIEKIKDSFRGMSGFMVQKTKSPKILNRLNGSVRLNGDYYRTVGVHHDLRVLTSEADLASKIPYPEYTNRLLKIRNKTGERQYLTKVLGQDPYTRGLPSNANKLLSKSKNLRQIVAPNKVVYHVVDKPQGKIGALLSKVKGMFR